MWKRSDLKARAKASFKRNYWKSVLISLLLALIVGGGSGTAVSHDWFDDGNGSQTVEEEASHTYLEELENNDSDYENGQWEAGVQTRNLEKEFKEAVNPAFIAVFVLVFVITFVLVMAVLIVLYAFVANPLEVGCRRFYLRNLNEPAQVGNIGYGFDNNYKNNVKTMFFRGLYTFLWTLLLVIPGIVKAYEYQMIPYLLADNPQMTKEQAFAESKRMMSGQKWRAFVLDLSFLGWNILSALTVGIVGIFYVQPYMDATHAALYDELRYRTEDRTVY